MGCPETSVRYYQSTLRKIPKRAQISFTPQRKSEVTRVTNDIRHSCSQKLLFAKIKIALQVGNNEDRESFRNSPPQCRGSQLLRDLCPRAAPAQYCIMFEELKEKQTCLLRHCEATNAPAWFSYSSLFSFGIIYVQKWHIYRLLWRCPHRQCQCFVITIKTVFNFRF